MATEQMPGTEIKQPFPAGPPNRLARTYCRVAGHTGDWTYPDAQCVRVRMCKRCGEVTSKQEHTWSAFGYVAASRCEQERRCQRCGAIESRAPDRRGRWLTLVITTRASSTSAVAAARRSAPATEDCAAGKRSEPTSPRALTAWDGSQSATAS